MMSEAEHGPPKGGETKFEAVEDGQYVAVEGLDQKSVELARVIEARAAAKTASDYQHIVWAYGLIWTLFALYGLYLWRRASQLRADLAELSRRLESDDR